MLTATFKALPVVAPSGVAALTVGDNFLFEDSQQLAIVGEPDINRVFYFTRIDQEKCCGTFGVMETKASASYGLDMVYPGPYPGSGYAAYAICADVITDIENW